MDIGRGVVVVLVVDGQVKVAVDEDKVDSLTRTRSLFHSLALSLAHSLWSVPNTILATVLRTAVVVPAQLRSAGLIE